MILRAGIAALMLPLSFALGQASSPRTSRIVGVVADSVDGTPIRGAEVIASGVAGSVRTDSLGRFTIDSLAPGRYQVGVFHPLLESLGITLATKPFVLGPDSAAIVNLAVPSVPSLVRRYCGAELSESNSAAVTGRVLDPDNDQPDAGAKVSLAWTDISVTKEAGVVRTPHERHAETDSNGFFKICAVPSDLYGTLQAVRGNATTPEIPFAMGGALLAYENLSIANSGSGNRPTGVVTGHILMQSGAPVQKARIDIPMSSVSTVSGEDGSFRFPEVQTGTQLLVAYSIGYTPTNEPVNVTSREPTDVTIVVGNQVNMLDPVLVNARRNNSLEKLGFNARQRASFGHFFTREDIDQRHPNEITDLLKGLSDVNVSYQRGGTVISGRSGAAALGPGNRTCTRLYLDGFGPTDLQAGDLDMLVKPEDVIGLEVYQGGEAPGRFQAGLDGGCLTLVVWTQVRGRPKR